MLARATPGKTWRAGSTRHRCHRTRRGGCGPGTRGGRPRPSFEVMSTFLVWRCPEWLPGLPLGRPGGQETPDIDAIAPMRWAWPWWYSSWSAKAEFRGSVTSLVWRRPEGLPSLPLGTPGGQETPDIDAIAPMRWVRLWYWRWSAKAEFRSLVGCLVPNACQG